MAEERLPHDVEEGLELAKEALEKIRERLMAGEQIDERELTMLARLVATELEVVRERLEEAVGPIDTDRMKEEMRRRVSPEDYQVWLAGEMERKAFQEEVRRERTLREQLGETKD